MQNRCLIFVASKGNLRAGVCYTAVPLWINNETPVTGDRMADRKDRDDKDGRLGATRREFLKVGIAASVAAVLPELFHVEL